MSSGTHRHHRGDHCVDDGAALDLLVALGRESRARALLHNDVDQLGKVGLALLLARLADLADLEGALVVELVVGDAVAEEDDALGRDAVALLEHGEALAHVHLEIRQLLLARGGVAVVVGLHTGDGVVPATCHHEGDGGGGVVTGGMEGVVMGGMEGVVTSGINGSGCHILGTFLVHGRDECIVARLGRVGWRMVDVDAEEDSHLVAARAEPAEALWGVHVDATELEVDLEEQTRVVLRVSVGLARHDGLGLLHTSATRGVEAKVRGGRPRVEGSS